jgi:hypothetical protein
MKSLSSLFTLCIYASHFTSNSVVHAVREDADPYESFFDRFYCTDPYDFVMQNTEYDIQCVSASIPPWPMCLFHDVPYFIDAALASASRCCDLENLDKCKCPFKTQQEFRDGMLEWCPKIETCKSSVEGDEVNIKEDLVSDSWTQMAMVLPTYVDKDSFHGKDSDSEDEESEDDSEDEDEDEDSDEDEDEEDEDEDGMN